MDLNIISKKKAKHRYLSVGCRKAIVFRRQRGEELKTIAKDFEIDPSTVTMIVKRFKSTNNLETKGKTGRPRKTDRHQNMNIKREFALNPRQRPREVISKLGLNISDMTLRRRAREMGLRPRRPAKKPYISERNMSRRLILAKKFQNYPNWFWKRVIWSDEKKFELLTPKKRVIVYRRPGQRYKLKYLQPTVKHGGGSIMLWGCMSYFGTGALVEIKGIMDQNKYCDILNDNLQFSADLMGLNKDYVFQQDLDPKHTALASREFFKDNDIRVLEWSPQSPDLNVIENLWYFLEQRVPVSDRTNKITFLRALQKTWSELPKELCRHLVESIPRRLTAIVNSRGAPT